MNSICPACNEKSIAKRNLLSRTNVSLDIYFCSKCGHGFQQEQEDYDIYSTGEFSKTARNNSSLPTSQKIKSLDKKAIRRFHFYKKYFNGIDSSLEVGSSIGSFVHLLKLDGVNAEGIEPDAEYAAFSKAQYSLSQEAILFENFHPNKKYDFIYSFHVIEHVPDPEAYVKKAHALLNNNGKILIECPSWDLHCFGDVKQTIWEPHLQYFTLSSMYSLLAKNGFEVQEVNFTGSALFAVAVKSENNTFLPADFRKFYNKYKRTFSINKHFPNLPLSIKGTKFKPLFLQYLLSKNNRSFTELIAFSVFAVKNILYLRKESGTSSKKASHVSYYSSWENAGDTVLSKCVRKTINQNVKTSWNLIKLTDPVTEPVIRQINKTSSLIIGGGGVLLPDSNPNSVSGWQWAIDPDYWQKIKVPVIVFAIGYNYFKGQDNSTLFIKNLEELVKRADFFSLRNHGSIRKVKELLPEYLHEKIHHQPCPTTIIRKLYPDLPVKRESKKIGINIAFDRYERRFGNNIYLILDQIALALNTIKTQGYEIYNVCHLENDRKFEISLEKRNVKFKTVNLQYALPNKVYNFYNNIELMMGMRGHAQMIPFGVNTKIISLGTHEKLAYFLEDIDAMDWYIDVHHNPSGLADIILEKFTAMMNIDKTTAEERIIQQQDKLFQITKNNLNVINRIL